MWKVAVLINTICAIGETIIYILLKREDAKENRRNKSDSRKRSPDYFISGLATGFFAGLTFGLIYMAAITGQL